MAHITLRADDAQAEQVFAQLDRVVRSETFRRSPSVCLLLRYFVTRLMEGGVEHIREVAIAAEVFHRGGDFDPRIDNIVRVQTHRLRKNLEMYYAGEGKADTLRFVLPKGSYVLLIHSEEEDVLTPPEIPDPPVAPRILSEPVVVPDELPRGESRSFAAACLISGAFVAGMAVLWAVVAFTGIDLRPQRGASQAENLRYGQLSRLWGGIIEPDTPTLVAFTNPVFLKAESGDMLFVYRGHMSAPVGSRIDLPPPAPGIATDLMRRAGPLYFSDSWTGTGEVLAVRKLVSQFAMLGLPLEVKRSRNLSFEDVRTSNVIFIGSPWGNKMLDKLSVEDRPFTCCFDGALPSVIANRSPRTGEPAEFRLVTNPATGELTASYGIFSVIPGVQAGRKLVISSGLTTHASWAALDYFTSTAGIEALTRKLGLEEGNALPRYFDAVIRTEIIYGEASKPSVVAVRGSEEPVK